MSEVIEQISVKDHFSYIKDLASKHGIKPLKGTETVTYVVLNHRVDYKTQRIFYPPIVQVKSEVSILDPKTKDAAMLIYVKSSKAIRKNGVDEFVEDRPGIFIEDGFLHVGVKDLSLYYHMEMSDENESKIGRDQSVPAKFRRIDATKSAQERISEADKRRYVLESSRFLPVDDLRAVATNFGLNIKRPTEEIRHDVMQKAEQNPDKYLEVCNDPKAKAKVLIMDAVSLEIIAYQEEDRKWMLFTKVAPKEILQVKPGEDPSKSLAEHLLSADGSKDMKTIKELISKNI